MLAGKYWCTAGENRSTDGSVERSMFHEGTRMRIFIAFVAWFAFVFYAGWWMASEAHEPEVKALELSSDEDIKND